MDPAYKRYFKTAGLLWAGCFLILGILYYFVLPPQKKLLLDIEGQLSGKKVQYRMGYNKTSDDEKLELKNETKRLKKKLSDFMVEVDDVDDLIFDINKTILAVNVGSYNNKSKLTEPYLDILNCDYIGENTIEIEFNANFYQFVQVINAMERYKPVIFVDKFNIKRSRKEPSHTVKMNLTFFVRKPIKNEIDFDELI